jgi:hypothetical protein
MMETTDAIRETGDLGRIGYGDVGEALGALAELRSAIAELDLPGTTGPRAVWVVDDLEDELRRSDPDRDVMASRLWRLTEFLQGSGADLGPETQVFDAIAGIAAFVGPLGGALLKRLS